MADNGATVKVSDVREVFERAAVAARPEPVALASFAYVRFVSELAWRLHALENGLGANPGGPK